jgi:hypothetical protein
MIRFITHLRWSNIRTIGNSPIVRASILMPVVGYLILLNQNLMTIETKYRYFFLHNPWRLVFIYYGFLIISVSAIMYALRCPHQIQKYSSPVEYMNSELEFLASFFRSKTLLESVGARVDGITPRQKRLLDFKTNEGVLNSVSFFRNPGSQLPMELRNTLRELITWDWGLADTSRVVWCYICTALYSAGFAFLLIPAACTFLDVTRYTISRLFSGD